jgi:hypothetical protein
VHEHYIFGAKDEIFYLVPLCFDDVIVLTLGVVFSLKGQID